MDKYTSIYEPLYKQGYHSKKDFTHAAHLIEGAPNYLSTGATILDIGCSNGTAVNLLTTLGYEAYGIDVSETAIELAHQNGAKKCVLGSATSIPFPDQSFDAVICTDVLEHIFFEDLPVTLREMNRVARQYAFLKISTAHEKNTGWVQYLRKTLKQDIDNLHVSVLSLDGWRDLFTAQQMHEIHFEFLNKHSFEIILQLHKND